MAEVMSAKVPQGYYQLFYVYLYLGSLLFLASVYIDVLRTKAQVDYVGPKNEYHWCEENEMVFVSHEVPFPATSDRRSRVAGNGTE